MDALTWIIIDVVFIMVAYVVIDINNYFALTLSIYEAYIYHVYKGKHFNF